MIRKGTDAPGIFNERKDDNMDISENWKVNTPQLLAEIVQCNPSAAIFAIPFHILKSILAELAAYGAKKNDPELNVLLLRLALYDVPPLKVQDAIDRERARMKRNTRKAARA